MRPTYFSRTYRTSRAWMLFLLLAGVGLMAGGVLLAFHLRGTSHNVMILSVLSTIMIAFGGYTIASTIRSKVILTESSIEVVEVFITRTLRKDDIRGWRFTNSSPRGLALEPKEGCGSYLEFAVVFEIDEILSKWLYSLPNLAIEDLKKEKVQIRNDERLGSTPGQRMRRVALGKRLEFAANAVALLLCGWLCFYPRPYLLAVTSVLSLPWIAVLLVRNSGGLLRLETRRNSKYPSVTLLFLLPIIALYLDANRTGELVDRYQMIAPALTIAISLILACHLADSSARKTYPFFAMFFSLLYGAAACVDINFAFDFERGKFYDAQVLGKDVVAGKNIQYKLHVTAWGPFLIKEDVTVGKPTYDAIAKGDILHMKLQPGALALPWYYFRDWTRGTSLIR